MEKNTAGLQARMEDIATFKYNYKCGIWYSINLDNNAQISHRIIPKKAQFVSPSLGGNVEHALLFLLDEKSINKLKRTSAVRNVTLISFASGIVLTHTLTRA